MKHAGGTALDIPGEDETVPEAVETPASHRPRPCSKGIASPRLDATGESLVLPNTQTPKRTRAAEKAEEFTRRHCETFREEYLSRGYDPQAHSLPELWRSRWPRDGALAGLF